MDAGDYDALTQPRVAVLDTGVCSAIPRDRLLPDWQGRQSGKTLAVTFVTVGELTKWTRLRARARSAWPGATFKPAHS
jgi:predicted nucleic acid-binding protein